MTQQFTTPELDEQTLLELQPRCEAALSTRLRLIPLLPFWRWTGWQACDSPAEWVVGMSSSVCTPHEHQVLYCSKHKNTVQSMKVESFRCGLTGNETSSFWVTRVEKL